MKQRNVTSDGTINRQLWQLKTSRELTDRPKILGNTSFGEFYVWVSVHHKLIYIKRTNVMQLGSMFICNCNIALHVSDAFCIHLQEHLATVEAASGE